MGKKIRISVRELNIKLEGVLNDTDTALAIWDALPIEAKANRWGDEVYFTIPVAKKLERSASDVVSPGDIGYWPAGKAFCLFFGPTPASEGDEIRAASPVNLVGKLTCSGLEVLKKVRDDQGITIERAGA